MAVEECAQEVLASDIFSVSPKMQENCNFGSL
jgi:hypothetical protein